eukprot:TRINITY_DN20033_c0_g1_i2.p1 TRINITY_DN20033_c0_g1~~TRINITY_DN20033_c0_g1_i2.p1  ORF type:complete len:441 (+),score=152.51 TRINITY_DN20033_c0_g1_i2:754-2076(+)
MASSFSFPLLPPKDIIANCKELVNLTVSEEELANATPERVKRVYEWFLGVTMGIRREDLQQPAFAALDKLAYPELHEDSIPELQFFFHLRKLMQTAGVRDFGLKDLNEPNSKTTRRNYSALINFAMFQCGRETKYLQNQNSLVQLKEQRQYVNDERLKYQAELDARHQQRAAEEPHVQQTMRDILALQHELSELNRAQESAQAELRELKGKQNEISETLNNTKFQIVNVRQDAQRLKSQIVQDPEKAKRNLQELRMQLESEKAAASDAEKRSRELQTKLDYYLRFEKEVNKVLAHAASCDKELAKKKQNTKELKASKQKLISADNVLKELNTQDSQLQRQLNSVQDKSAKLAHKQDTMKDSSERNLQEIRNQKMEAAKKNAMLRAEAERLDNERSKCLEQMNEMKEEHHEGMIAIKQKLELLSSCIGDYHGELFADMKSV